MPQAAIERAIALAARLFQVPIALVALAGDAPARLAGALGLAEAERPQALALAAEAGRHDGPWLAPLEGEAALGEAAEGEATGGNRFRFFVGAPVGAGLRRRGVLCLADRVPRALFPEHEAASLADLALLLAEALERQEALEALHRRVEESGRAEEALRREREFSELLVKSSGEGILVFDRELRCTLWNPGMEAISGRPAAAVLGRAAAAALPFLVGSPTERAMRGAIAGRETSLYEQRYALPEVQGEGYFDIHLAPLYDHRHEIIGGIAFLRETTERRRTEEALRQSQKMEAVGQLTGGIAHDFNNMLTVIGGNLELLETWLANEPALLRLVNAAALASTRAAKLTQQLLAFSRRQHLNPQLIDFNQVVIGMDDLLRRTLGERIEVKKALTPDLWRTRADRHQLEATLLNLLLNARDAMPEGGRIVITTANVEIEAQADGEMQGAYAQLTIADSGHGMTATVLARAFEPFFTTKEVGRGTGLGLSMAYGFVKQSGGHIRIDSEPGQGTSVQLYLPRAETGGEEGRESGAPRCGRQGDETVLVVEDDQGVRDFAASVLRAQGYRVLEAANGDSALETLAGHPRIDLLFTDMVMPGAMHGLDLARAAIARQPALKVIFTSAYATRLVACEWPADRPEFLRKPYRSTDLATRVRAVLDQPGGAARRRSRGR